MQLYQIQSMYSNDSVKDSHILNAHAKFDCLWKDKNVKYTLHLLPKSFSESVYIDAEMMRYQSFYLLSTAGRHAKNAHSKE